MEWYSFLIQCQLIDEWRINDPASFSIVIFGVSAQKYIYWTFLLLERYFGGKYYSLVYKMILENGNHSAPFFKNMWNNCHKKEKETYSDTSGKKEENVLNYFHFNRYLYQCGQKLSPFCWTVLPEVPWFPSKISWNGTKFMVYATQPTLGITLA